MTYESLTRAGRCLLAGGALVAVGCGEATGPQAGFSAFSADVRGTVNERIRGTASAGDDSWTRQLAIQIDVSDGTLSSIVLLGDGGQTISFTRRGADFPVGTHRLGRLGTVPGQPTAEFSSGYVVRKTNGLQVFLADSGSLAITEAASRVSGTFTLYASEYRVLPLPIPTTVGTKITPIETGKANLTITGSFAAARR
jgi:hypothetical protein